jgi:iron complex transport system substrate-binding protein
MKKRNNIVTGLCLSAALFLFSCGPKADQDKTAELINEKTRIVSLNGSVTEVLCQLGLEDKISGVDVTSTFPESIQKLPKVGHNRNIAAEAVVALSPTLVVGLDEQMKPELLEQLKGANIRVIPFHLEYNPQGTKDLVNAIADSLGKKDAAKAVTDKIDADLAKVQKPAQPVKVLFIYARGAGTLMVAGQKTAPNRMIELAGAQNAATGFEDFKPLTPEALVEGNPDVILMFDSGLQSLGGIDGLLQVPGIKETNAGRNKRVIEMDGQLLAGFGPRVGEAVTQLAQQLNEVSAH